ncbi:hypothetical protein JCM10908_003859 [Rhodotorula pacifica]|uniref:uncharacterized protein n=1 Tax=Rhodotorula pacifica TaxID=1495444 RepID=UPI003180374C
MATSRTQDSQSNMENVVWHMDSFSAALRRTEPTGYADIDALLQEQAAEVERRAAVLKLNKKGSATASAKEGVESVKHDA